MAYTWQELAKLTDSEIIAEHDRQAKSALVGLDYFIQEIARRDQDRQTQEMLRLTKQITLMTVVMTVATVVNLLATVALLFR